MNGDRSVGLPWVAVFGFIRITTNPKIVFNPLTPDGACARVRSWLDRPQAVLIHPGGRHAEILSSLLRQVGAAGNLTTDAHLAALAIEHMAKREAKGRLRLQCLSVRAARYIGSWRGILAPSRRISVRNPG